MIYVAQICDEHPISIIQKGELYVSTYNEAMMNPFPDRNPNSFLGKPFSADSLFSDLSEKTLQSFKKIKKTTEFKEHKLIYDVGESPGFVHIFLTGEANLFLKTADARFEIRHIEPNEVLGLTESLACFPYETGVETISTCICETIKRQDLIRLLRRDAKITFRLLQMLAYDLQESYRQFSNLVIKA